MGDPQHGSRPAAQLAEALAVAGLEPPSGGDIPLFDPAAIAAALVDASGKVTWQTPAFRAVDGERLIDMEVVRRASRGAPPRIVQVEPGSGGPSEGMGIVAYALASRASGWRLPPPVKEAAEARPTEVVVLTCLVSGARRPLESACEAYGLTGLRGRVVVETIRNGSVRLAARAAGVSYNTARRAMKEALAKAHAPRLAALVSSLTSVAFGVLPKADATSVLQDLWGLTPRQGALAVLVAGGDSRAAAAQALSISDALARKELERVYETLQVSSTVELARRVVEAEALRWLTDATGGDAGFVDRGLEPLQFAHRPNGTRIAFSDYGPSSGRPVLVLHSNLSTRLVSRRLLAALHAAGFRPIAIDRPGYGLTDEAARPSAYDPFAAAAGDVEVVLDRIGLAAVDVVARGAAQVVLALDRLLAGRLGRVVLVNPAPHVAASGRREGPMGRLKAIYLRNPALIRLVVMAYARQVNFEKVTERLGRSVRGSPPDEAIARDPEFVRDYRRSIGPFHTGRIEGYVDELTAMTQAVEPTPRPGRSNWRILLGASDFLHDPDKVETYWRRVLPDTPFLRVEEAGRFLAMSHPDYVVDALVRNDG